MQTTVMREMIWKRVSLETIPGIQWALELRWRRAEDCSRGGFQPPEMHDHRQWTAVYVGSLSARKTMTGDVGGWNWWHTGCDQRDIVALCRGYVWQLFQPSSTSVAWKLSRNCFKIISQPYCSSWMFSSMFVVAEIILKKFSFRRGYTWNKTPT